MRRNLTVGVDFGTSSVRALVLDCASGEELATAAGSFPRWARGEFCDPARSVFRQHPLELIEAFSEAVSGAVGALSTAARDSIRALTVDTTGSSPTAVDSAGVPLALRDEFSDDPDAMVVLWKDRSAEQEAQELTDAASRYPRFRLLSYCGGRYSSEWYWAKVWRIVRTNEAVAEAAADWLEQSDWFPALLCGAGSVTQIRRNRCAAAHKALWHTDWNGFPPQDFFELLDSRLLTVRRRLPSHSYTADSVSGRLTEYWARRLGLPAGIPVGVGLFDAHSAAIGAGVRSGVVSKVIGTSSAEMIVTPAATLEGRVLDGIESQAQGSIDPDLIGIEAGQPAYGDLFNWFSSIIAHEAATFGADPSITAEDVTASLSARAAERIPDPVDPVALDWINGRRAPFSNSSARAALEGLALGTDAPAVFGSLVHGAAFGTRAIHDYLVAQGMSIDETRVVGGIPQKSPFVVQTLANALETPVGVSSTAHASARGAAIMAAVASGLFTNTAEAVERLGAPVVQEYRPDARLVPAVQSLYARYLNVAQKLDTTFNTH